MMEEHAVSTPQNGVIDDIAAVYPHPTTPGTTSGSSTPSEKVSSLGKPGRLSRGSGQEKSVLAVRAFHSPGTNIHFATKKEAAACYGVSPPLFSKYEKEMLETGVLSSVVDGSIPAPDLPDGFLPLNLTAQVEEFEAARMAKVKLLLESRCTRLGDNSKYGKHGTIGMYREGVKWAVDEMHKKLLPRDGRRASTLLSTIGIDVSKSTLHSKLCQHEQQVAGVSCTILTPVRCGSTSRIPYRYELKLAEYVQVLRSLKLKAGKSLLIGAANFLIRDTEIAERFAHKEVRYGWYYSFRKRWGIKVRNQTRLEMDRARWSTAAHFKEWYDVVMNGMIQCGIAVKNETFDPNKPYDTMFTITDTDMVFEWDQTGFTLDQTDDGKGVSEKTMTIDADDAGECVANKSTVRWTITGGSFMNGDSLPGCATPPTKSMQLALMKDPPLSTIIDKSTGKGFPCQFSPHHTGGFSYELAPLWLKEVVGPCLPKKDGKRSYGLCDGYGAHTTLPMVNAADEIGCDLQLRVPHTSHVSQVADVANFPKFKRLAKQAKSDMLVAKVTTGQLPRLTAADMPAIIKTPWESAFHPETSRKGWKEIGFDPATKSCDRKLYWDTKAKEDAATEKLSQAGATEAVLDARCQRFQFHRRSPGENREGDSNSDSDDSGDSGTEIENMRLGGEDFRLGPLTYGAGRQRLEQRQKRKAEQEEQKNQRAVKRLQKEQDQATQRQLAVKEAATILWKWRDLGVKAAICKLQKKHLSALLVLTHTPDVKGTEANTVLSAALEKKLLPLGVDSTVAQQLDSLKSLVSIFIDV